jgi:alkanesulfonate monooxygenase SsuD/methylene tetrahydromethanopterin reductase-like flavin-dependent oxidoreductase (luciferase family)
MAELGIVITPGAEPYATMAGLAREAEAAGFSGIFISESNNDAMICCAEMARATSTIKLVTWIVNIHFRVPVTCAGAAAMVQELSDGRFILGLGVSHRPLLESLGIEMGNGRHRLRDYTLEVRRLLRGEALSPGLELRVRAPRHPVPIYYAALALETARLAGELADGVELYMCPAQRMRRLAQAAREEASRHGRKPSDVTITMGLPTFLHDDLGRAMGVARRRLVFYGSLPFYNRQMARAGFEAEATAAMAAAQRGDKNAIEAAMSDRLLDSMALIGPPARCLERLAAFREAGAQWPIIRPNEIDQDQSATVRSAIEVFSRAV